ncbi:MAG: type 12 methyltransferase [Saprospiraceae bacterium]|nr:MAG: type 12 methyltransferase [Saprospiraceae bacterium]
MDEQTYFDANRLSWDQRTKVHKDSDFYDLVSFLSGKSSLMSVETEALGDVAGKSLLHLQCHFGQDTLSWARKGAKVTGVDFSGEAIRLARELNEQLKLDARFVECNIYDLPQHLEGQFDIVFTTYGVIGWLPDLERWAKIIRHFLKPGGTFLLVEFHPIVWMFDDDFTKIKYPYHNAGVIAEENTGTYADREAPIKRVEYGWNHSLSEVIGALLKEGLQVEQFEEFNYSPYDCFNQTVEVAPGRWQIKGLEGTIPMMYSVKAIAD